MIYFCTPYSLEKCLGRFMNREMESVSIDDWVCFTDGDAMFTLHDFGHKISRVISESCMGNTPYGLLTCMTNRVGTEYQCVKKMYHEESMVKHWQYGSALWKSNGTNVRDITNMAPLSGVMILIKKRAWKKAGGFHEGGILGVDNKIHRSVASSGQRVGLMEGIYLMHYYRGGKRGNNRHLK